LRSQNSRSSGWSETSFSKEIDEFLKKDEEEEEEEEEDIDKEFGGRARARTCPRTPEISTPGRAEAGDSGGGCRRTRDPGYGD